MKNGGGRLPEKLLEYWHNEGWATYQNGLFAIVNPDDYEDIVDEWLEDTPYISNDIYHAIARSAFGDIFLCGEKTGTNIKICCPLNSIYVTVKHMKILSAEGLNEDIDSFFSCISLESCDIRNNQRKSLFQPVLKKLGPLADNEIYGFVPALVAGGNMDINNIQKLDYSIHMSILREFADPKIVEV